MLNSAIKLYEQGLTQKEVAYELGTTQKVIWRLFKNAGYKCRVAKKRNQYGKNNDSWRGNNAGYAANHRRVEVVRGKPTICARCDNDAAKRYEWANISGEYSNVYDYIRLCKSCHAIFDNIVRNFNKIGGDTQ